MSVTMLAAGLVLGAAAYPRVGSIETMIQSRWSDWRSVAVTVTVPAAGHGAAQAARFVAADRPAPLVVDLHQWGETYAGSLGNDVRLDRLVAARGWNYIRPNLAGPNNTPAACCSEGVTDAVKAAVDYAIAHGRVDRRAIYVVGISGGAYTALCTLHSGKVPVRRYIAWVPIADLESWYDHHAFDHYGQDIRQCTASSGKGLDVAAARRRSPLYMPLPAQIPAVHLYHGIRDGMVTSVSPDQSVTWFNRVALATGHDTDIVSDATRLSILDRRVGPDQATGRSVAGRRIHFDRRAGTVQLTLFEGDHEGFMVPTMDELARDYRTLGAAPSSLPDRVLDAAEKGTDRLRRALDAL
ncbi:prolyl oligopeptidase family protein [Sphingomonas sp. BK235]|nr:prolyl oligopeptidase family protein [Sphingomonas sp. BK235]